MSHTDAELLDAWRAGDNAAGNQLFRRHYGSVHRFLANKVDGEVEDFIQRTFEACVHGRERFEGRSSFRAFLLGIARNLVRKHWENRRRRPRPSEIEAHSLEELGAGPSTLLVRRAEHRRLLHALRRLPLAQQTALELYFWEELTGPELAEVLGVPEDTARSRVRRAKLRLGEELARLERRAQAAASTSDDLDRWVADIRAQLRVDAS